jgi:hypothetical protein
MPTPTYHEILEIYNNLLTLPPKEKYKKIRSVAALAAKALIETQDTHELAFYANIFKMADNSKLLNKAKVKEFELKGIAEVKTLKTKLGAVNIESGMIAVGDPTLGYTHEYSTKDVVYRMNQYDFYCVGTGGDGSFDVTLRLVDIDEPLLGPKEYKFIINNSKTSVINITSGYIKCSDFWDIAHNEVQGVGYEIENGYYKVAFYLKSIRDKYFGFVIVLSKTDAKDVQEIAEIETLG